MRNKQFKKILLALTFVLALIAFTGCGSGYDEEALHINYSEDEVYGSEDYLGSTVTIGGDGMEKETVVTVAELEQIAVEDEELRYQGDYSMMSRGGEFSNHKFTGIKLYEFLKDCGLKADLDDSTPVKFVSVDGYALKMELGEIIESSDNTYAAKTDTAPTDENVPKILAFGSDGVPLTGTVGSMKLGEDITEEQGFVEETENVGGPVRLISGQQSVGEFNAPDNAKWLRQIIVGEDNNAKAHADALTAEQALRSNDKVVVDESKGMWNHSEEPYTKYLNTKLKITGSEAKKRTYTLQEIEQMAEHTVTDSFGASAGVNGYRGVILRHIVMSNLADGVDRPSKIIVVGQDGYETEVDVDDMLKGVDSRYQGGEHRDIIIAYAIDGEPMVPDEKAAGGTGKNGYGPMRLIVENQTTRWVKSVAEIRIGK